MSLKITKSSKILAHAIDLLEHQPSLATTLGRSGTIFDYDSGRFLYHIPGSRNGEYYLSRTVTDSFTTS